MKKLDSVIVRQAVDDFHALQIATAMQSFSDVEIVSIVFQDCEPKTAEQQRGRWHVFAKYASVEITPQHIDHAIIQQINSSR